MCIRDSYTAFHQGRRTLRPGSRACRAWQARMRDVSWCMRHLQHLYSIWYNHSRPIRRRGPLWAGRFKNTVLEDGAALWALSLIHISRGLTTRSTMV